MILEVNFQKKINVIGIELDSLYSKKVKMKILMVCLGNICRSPLAEGLLRDKLKKYKLSDTISVDSAGTSGYHAGEMPDIRSTAHARKKGIHISELVSRQFVVEDYDNFDRIYVMDHNNYKDVVSLARNAKDKSKVELILNVSHPGKNMPVPDPYFGGEAGFENVYNLLNEACEVLLNSFINLNSK